MLNLEMNLQNTSEPRLPTHGLKSHNYEEEVGYLLLAILPVTLFAGLPLVYIVLLFLKYISCKIFKNLNQMCTKCKQVVCSAKVKWNKRGKVCEVCNGSCKFSHKVTEL